MKNVSITCDKCGKELNNREPDGISAEVIFNRENMTFDLCPKCYNSLLNKVSLWFMTKED